MKKLSILFTILVFAFSVYAQDDLLSMMQKESPSKPSPVFATFKSTRVINLQSNETMKAKHLDFRIQHRFGMIDMSPQNVFGLYDLFGMDAARMRLSLDYGITDDIMVGLGRTDQQVYDMSLKIKLKEQTTKGKGAFPIGIVYYGDMGINTQAWAFPGRDNFLTSRLTFVNQLIITRKFNEWISFELVPSMIHHNIVPNGVNDIYALGIGTSIKITRSTRFNIEYIPRFNAQNQAIDNNGTIAYDEFAVGFDIETGGHVFQLQLTNAQGLIEQQFITENPNKLALNTIHLGFNLSRTFSFDKAEAAKNAINKK
jgi:Membrane bound beta barrel domain (DUF5777)